MIIAVNKLTNEMCEQNDKGKTERTERNTKSPKEMIQRN